MKTIFIVLFLIASVFCINSQDLLSPNELAELSYERKIEMAKSGNIQIQLDIAYQNYFTENKEYIQRAIYWFREAAGLGSAEAQYMMGLINEEGKATPINWEKAFNWYGMSAEQGYRAAQAALGRLYLSGRGVGRDHDKARYWYEKAAAQDDLSSEYYYDLLTKIKNSDQESMNYLMLKAVENSNFLTVQALLDGGVNVDVRDDWGSTALMIAANRGSIDTVKLLLDYGADVNAIDYDVVSTPLLAAVSTGHIEIARILLAAGANAVPDIMYSKSASAAAKRAGYSDLSLLLEIPEIFSGIEEPIAFISASSFLRDKNNPGRYSPNKLFDSDPLTSWVAAGNSSGIGAELNIRFSKSISIDTIEVMPGYFDAIYWEKNNRIRYIKFWIDGAEYGIPFEDVMEAQRFSIDYDRPITLDRISFIIDSIYKGSKWNDTCIAEIAFYRDGRKLKLVNGNTLTGTEIPLDSNGP